MVDNGGLSVKNGWVRISACACALLLAGVLDGCALTTPPLSEVQSDAVKPTVSAPTIMEDGTLTVAVDASDAPQAMEGTDGEPTGYYVDVARALAQRMGLKVKIVSVASAERALDGKADVFIGASASDAPDDATVFGSVGEDASAVFVKADGSQNASDITAEDMADGTVAVQDSSASQDALVRAGITASQKAYANVNECFKALAAGEVQYVACDATAGAYLARAYRDVSFAGTIGKASSFGFAVSDTGDLESVVSDALDALAQDGTLDAVRSAWYGDLPSDLSDAVLSGVTVSATDKDDEPASSDSTGDAEAPDDSASKDSKDNTNVIGDINSLID